MKVTVNKEGKILIDDLEINIDQLTPEVLEKILEEGLSDNVVFNLPDDTSHPIASLMKELQELTLKDSEFRNKINEIVEEQHLNEKKLEIAETTDEHQNNTNIDL